MNNARENYYKKLFLTAALYDLALGIVFLFFYRPLFHVLKIPLPLNPSYLLLSAAFVFVLGIAYYFIYRDIKSNRDLVKIGTIYKFAYVSVGLYCLLLGLVPHMIFLVFAAIDVVFFSLFVEFLAHTKR